MTRLILLPLIALAACNAAPEASASSDVGVAAPVKDVETLPPDETVITEPAEDAAAAASMKAIPVAFHGRWGMVPNDCDPRRDDAKGLIEIGGDSMKFYESRAKLSRVTGAWTGKIEAEFAFTGEGRQWTKAEALSLADSGNTLVRTEDGGAFTYKRCPAT